MKDRPLSFQIWAVIAATTLFISVLMALLLPSTLRGFFTREIFATIETAQELRLAEVSLEEVPRLEQGDIRVVNHLVFRPDGRLVSGRLPAAFLQEARREALAQERPIQRYSRRVGGQTVFYVIRKETLQGRPFFLLSYMGDTYRDDLVRTLFRRLMGITGLVLLLSWLPAVWFASYLSRPLVALERHVGRIARRDWHEPVKVDRKDEIGSLARSVELMRRLLVRRDEAQQTFLQHVSHDLKTPVMIIQSYVQSIRDGIFPPEELPGTLRVIETEAGRLEKRVRDLLYLTKLDYLNTRERKSEPVDLGGLAGRVVERMKPRRQDLKWSLDLEGAEVRGDREQLAVALENLLDNALRYAAERVKVSVRREGSRVVLEIFNDGPPIEEPVMKRLFDSFSKGDGGEFGLGLAIVKRITALHDAEIRAENTGDGVSFRLEFPPV